MKLIILLLLFCPLCKAQKPIKVIMLCIDTSVSIKKIPYPIETHTLAGTGLEADHSKETIEETTKETVSVIKPTEVDKIKSDRAYDLGKRLLETCNTSKFKAFTKNEATDKVIANATAEKISTTCKKINQRNGKFLGIKLLEVKHDKILDEYTFRYAMDYEKKLFKRE